MANLIIFFSLSSWGVAEDEEGREKGAPSTAVHSRGTADSLLKALEMPLQGRELFESSLLEIVKVVDVEHGNNIEGGEALLCGPCQRVDESFEGWHMLEMRIKGIASKSEPVRSLSSRQSGSSGQGQGDESEPFATQL